MLFHAYIIPIATCFIHPLYHFYAFSGTNLLTRCHSVSSVFSAVFRFRKSIKEIFSESDETNCTVNNITRGTRSTNERRSGAPRPPRHRWARPRCGPRPPMATPPRAAPDAASSPIYRPRHVNSRGNRHNRKNTSVLRCHPKLRFGGQKSLFRHPAGTGIDPRSHLHRPPRLHFDSMMVCE